MRETKVVYVNSIQEIFEAVNPPTDTQLKQALAKMLPEKIMWSDAYGELCYITTFSTRDTELLHFCWLVEETLTLDQMEHYKLELCVAYGCNAYSTIESNTTAMILGTWQQRTTALAKVLGKNLDCKYMKTPEQIHAEVGQHITQNDGGKYRAFTVSDIAKIIDEANGGVCEWEVAPIFLPSKTKCGNTFSYHNFFKHCPGCGKEIKIV